MFDISIIFFDILSPDHYKPKNKLYITFEQKKTIVMFSKACEYAIRASIFIAKQSLLQKKVGRTEIAEAIEEYKNNN